MANEIKAAKSVKCLREKDLVELLSIPSDKRSVIPNIGWDKPFYAVMNGKLREVFIKRIDFMVLDFSYIAKCSNAYYHLNVAGIGEVSVFCASWDVIPFTMYESVDDFFNGENYSPTNRPFAVDMFMLALKGKKRYVKMGEDFIGGKPLYYDLYQYLWDKEKLSPRKVRALVPSVISYTDKLGFFYPQGYELPKGVYADVEGCIKDNQIELVTFDSKMKPTINVEINVGTQFVNSDTNFIVLFVTDDKQNILVKDVINGNVALYTIQEIIKYQRDGIIHAI